MKLSLRAAALMMLVCTAFGDSGSRDTSDRRGTRPVKLTVFYQLTKLSFNFFTNELYPTYLAVNGYSKSQTAKLAVELKPMITYSCSSEKDYQKKFSCGNTKLHACASSLTSPKILETDWQRLNFVSCSMSSSYYLSNRLRQESKNEACVTATCIDATRLAFCANSADGDAILEANFEEFQRLNVTLTEKPVLVFDNRNGEVQIVGAEDHDKGLDNLMALLCKKFSNSFDGCGILSRVTSQKQFSFTDEGAFPLTRRCDYLTYANQIRG